MTMSASPTSAGDMNASGINSLLNSMASAMVVGGPGQGGPTARCIGHCPQNGAARVGIGDGWVISMILGVMIGIVGIVI